MKSILLILTISLCETAFAGNARIRLCDEPLKNGEIPCEMDVSMTQYLEAIVEYDDFYGDSIGVKYQKDLYFYLVSSDIKTAMVVTFVLRKTLSAEKNTYKELERKTVNIQVGWNMVWQKWSFTKPDLYWVDAYIDDELAASSFVEIRKQ